MTDKPKNTIEGEGTEPMTDVETRDALTKDQNEFRAAYIEAHRRAVLAHLRGLLEAATNEARPMTGFCGITFYENGGIGHFLAGACPTVAALGALEAFKHQLVDILRARAPTFFVDGKSYGDQMRVRDGKVEVVSDGDDDQEAPKRDKRENGLRLAVAAIRALTVGYGDSLPDYLVTSAKTIEDEAARLLAVEFSEPEGSA